MPHDVVNIAAEPAAFGIDTCPDAARVRGELKVDAALGFGVPAPTGVHCIAKGECADHESYLGQKLVTEDSDLLIQQHDATQIATQKGERRYDDRAPDLAAFGRVDQRRNEEQRKPDRRTLGNVVRVEQHHRHDERRDGPTLPAGPQDKSEDRGKNPPDPADRDVARTRRRADEPGCGEDSRHQGQARG
ncbi:hypothetical protein GCM10027298_30990 [Epidermidibacterium keratini]